MTTLADVHVEATSWLWPGHLPAGCLALLAGHREVGKSLLCADLIGRITRGVPWPDSTACPQGPCWVYAIEDDRRHMLGARLLATGANPQLVHFREGTLADVPTDIRADPPRLVVFDPLLAFLPEHLRKQTDPQAIREHSKKIISALGEHGTTILGIIHPPKDRGLIGTDDIQGSSAWPDIARCIWRAIRLSATQGFVWVQKLNHAAKTSGGWRYTYFGHQTLVGGQFENVGRVRWEGFEALPDLSGDDEYAMTVGIMVARALLANGPVLAKDFGKAMTEHSLSRYTWPIARKLGLSKHTINGTIHLTLPGWTPPL